MIMIIAKLFLVFLRVGFFAIGGAYSFLPLIEKEVVERYDWLTREEFMDVLALVKVFPGAISVKYATYTGYKIAGISGAISANLGNLFAPALLIVFGVVVYTRYKDLEIVRRAFDRIHFAILAMIIAVAFRLVNVNHLMQFKNILILVISFILFIYTKVHPALIVIGAGVFGIVFK